MDQSEREQWQRKLLETEAEVAKLKARLLVKDAEILALKHELWLRARDQNYDLSMGLA